MMQVCLRLYCREGQKIHGHVLSDWLLDNARSLGVTGGTVLRASAGFGRHGMHEDAFFELGGELPVIIELVVTQVQAEAVLSLCGEHTLQLFYTQTPVAAGITG